MRVHQPLDYIFDRKSKLKIMRCLIQNGLELNGRQIASEIQMNPAACHNALKELAACGLLQMRNVGKNHLYQVNTQNYLITEVLTPLFKKEQQLFDKILQFIKSEIRTPFMSLVLFGSMASATETMTSDIDLFVLVETDEQREQLQIEFDDLSLDILQIYSTMLSPYILTVFEFRQKFNSRNKLVLEILKTGKLISGKKPWEVLAVEVHEK